MRTDSGMVTARHRLRDQVTAVIDYHWKNAAKLLQRDDKVAVRYEESVEPWAREYKATLLELANPQLQIGDWHTIFDVCMAIPFAASCTLRDLIEHKAFGHEEAIAEISAAATHAFALRLQHLEDRPPEGSELEFRTVTPVPVSPTSCADAHARAHTLACTHARAAALAVQCACTAVSDCTAVTSHAHRGHDCLQKRKSTRERKCSGASGPSERQRRPDGYTELCPLRAALCDAARTNRSVGRMNRNDGAMLLYIGRRHARAPTGSPPWPRCATTCAHRASSPTALRCAALHSHMRWCGGVCPAA